MKTAQATGEEAPASVRSVKVVLVGDGGCGKTSLLMVFTNGDFPEVSACAQDLRVAQGLRVAGLRGSTVPCLPIAATRVRNPGFPGGPPGGPSVKDRVLPPPPQPLGGKAPVTLSINWHLPGRAVPGTESAT